ncbi:MAG: amino acid adenylation domain-containing protein, partial [bacterium]|nr:amino acid adenylation domain-containing protein [bacterium]
LDELGEYNEFEGIELIDIHSIYKTFSNTGARQTTAGIRHPASGKHPESTIAYILYTSGTTGVPKAVIVEHKSVVRLVTNTGYIDFSRYDRLLQTGALSFDASTFEIWGALKNGLTLYLEKKETILSANNMKEIVNRYGIDVLWMTSALFNHHVQEDIRLFKGIKHLLVGGDVVSPGHVNRLRKEYPGIRVTNGYGPTENTTFSTTLAVERDYPDKIPIGKPISNSKTYIVNKNNRLCPIGVPGELLVGGDGLARGYLNNPELTSEKFVNYKEIEIARSSKLEAGSDKEKRQQTQQNETAPSFPNNQYPITDNYLYRTGDFARWLPDGNIEFLGRIDHQVKIRGFRIELGEIETRLLTHPEIKEAVVLNRESKKDDKFLCAYYVTCEKQEAEPEPDLRQYLSQGLPDYMNPSFFLKLDKIPLTPNGKIDRIALSQYPISNLQTQTHTVHRGPRNKREEKLRRIWAKILGTKEQEIGMDDNFFDIGGHSLSATGMASQIHKEFDVKLPLAEIFKNTSIMTLAETIKKKSQDK